jgi:D-beta-D-heptose 7-phosphate kinase/D-beta-D-heptose 1-phosphate adenosyltransferase
VIGRALSTLESLGRPRVLVVGDAILDRYVWGRVSRISPEAPIQVLDASAEEARAGGGANVARNLASLGARASFAGAVGRDAEGRLLLRALRRDGVSPSAVVVDPRRPTSTKTRMMAHRHQLLRLDRERRDPLEPAVERALAARIRAARADLIVVSDYHKGTMTPAVCAALLSKKIPVIVGLKSAETAKYRGATGASLNRAELRAVTRRDDLDAGARRLMRALDLRFLVVTLGERGLALYAAGERPVRLPTEARQVFDVAGAGDTLLAAFALAYGSGLPLRECARVGNLAAGIVVGKVGVEVTTRREMAEHLLAGGRRAASKVVSERALLRALAAERARGRRIVFTNGCFDLLHAGHVALAEFARAQGDLLVVALNTDRSVRGLKGPSRPIVPQADRARVVAALEAVDYVCFFDEPTPARLAKLVRPDVLVKGEDYAGRRVAGADHSARVELAPLLPGSSTSALIRRVLEANRDGR